MSRIDIFKKINRNAFNEKLIHRYLFERYYFGSAQQRRKLLPERLQKSEINLIVPENIQNDAQYRADLTLYFKGQKLGVPVEVKWLAGAFNKKNQIDYLKNNDGFLIILGDTKLEQIEGVDVVQIKHDDFADWIADNISRLSRESLIYQAESKKLADKNQFWVVFLKGGNDGSAIQNFDRMLAADKKYPFWAFRQHAKALPNILDMQRGDKIFFIFASSHGMAQPKHPKTKVTVHRYYLGEIIEPYYMALDKQRGCFFEASDNIEINNRRWPHFIDFKIIKNYDRDPALSFGHQVGFSEAFSNSFNYGGGTPYPLSRAQFENLKDVLAKLANDIKNKG